MSFKKNFLKNGLASTFQKGVRVGEQLILVPFFISAWGPEYYGEWITLTIIPTIIGMSDLGFGTASANSFILSYAADQKQKAANIAKSGFFAISCIVILSIIVSIVSIFVLNYFDIFDKSLIDKKDAIFAVIFLMIARVLGFYQQYYEAFFKATRKAAKSINLVSIFNSIKLISSIILLLSGVGIIFYSLNILIMSIIFIFIYSYLAKKNMTILYTYKGVILRENIIQIFKKGFGYLLTPVWQAIFFQGTTFVVRILLGPVAVTTFNTVRTATRSLNQINGIINSSTLPELQFEIGASNFSKARQIFRFSLSAVIIISLIGVLILFFWGPQLYNLWTRNVLNLPILMWNIFLVGIIFNGIWLISSHVLIAANRPYDFVVFAAIASTLSVIMTYFLTKMYGLTGAAISSLLLDLSLTLYIFPRSCSFLNQPINTIVRDFIPNLNSAFKIIFKKRIS